MLLMLAAGAMAQFPSFLSAVREMTAPACFVAEFRTSLGSFYMEATREWSPLGVDRFYSLVHAGFYDNTRVYRVVPGWVAQFGYSGDPQMQSVQTIIRDDPVLPSTSNRRGVLSFSAAYDEAGKHATNRTTELFINLADHAQLDGLGFSPIGKITDGMDVVDSFFDGYGEMTDACQLHGFTPCDGPTEAGILRDGNTYLDAQFPQLTHILTAQVLPSTQCTPHPHPAPTPQGRTRHRPWVALGALLISLVVCLAVRGTIWLCFDCPRLSMLSSTRDGAAGAGGGGAADVITGWELNDAARHAAVEVRIHRGEDGRVHVV